MGEPVRLILYGRSYCHLCGEMEEALMPLAGEMGFNVECIDVDTDPALDEKYGELVPVLVLNGREVCHYHLDESAVRAAVGALSPGIH